MKHARNTLILLAALMCALPALAASPGNDGQFADESLRYKVMFKWGMVNKQAGSAQLNIRNQGAGYKAWLTAASASWADAIYRVRDTLVAKIQKEPFRPLLYQKMSHEGSEYKRDEVRYTYHADGSVTGSTRRVKWDDGELKANQKLTLEAKGTTVDMLTVFYYMRTIDYPRMKPGQVLTMNIFSGKRKELLTIKYVGTQNVSYDGKTYPCFYITFTFTEHGKKDSSDPMYAWISRDASRIPIKLEGKLPVGKVQCLYTGRAK